MFCLFGCGFVVFCFSVFVFTSVFFDVRFSCCFVLRFFSFCFCFCGLLVFCSFSVSGFLAFWFPCFIVFRFSGFCVCESTNIGQSRENETHIQWWSNKSDHESTDLALVYGWFCFPSPLLSMELLSLLLEDVASPLFSLIVLLSKPSFGTCCLTLVPFGWCCLTSSFLRLCCFPPSSFDGYCLTPPPRSAAVLHPFELNEINVTPLSSAKWYWFTFEIFLMLRKAH